MYIKMTFLDCIFIDHYGMLSPLLSPGNFVGLCGYAHFGSYGMDHFHFVVDFNYTCKNRYFITSQIITKKIHNGQSTSNVLTLIKC